MNKAGQHTSIQKHRLCNTHAGEAKEAQKGSHETEKPGHGTHLVSSPLSSRTN
jgi:hypothetical protein